MKRKSRLDTLAGFCICSAACVQVGEGAWPEEVVVFVPDAPRRKDVVWR